MVRIRRRRLDWRVPTAAEMVPPALPQVPAPPLPPPFTGLWLWRELRAGLLFCGLITLVLTALWDKPFLSNLVYSYAIGLLTQALIELGRYGLSAWVRLRHPQDEEARAHWPGWARMVPWLLLSVALGYAGGSLIGDAILGGHHARDLFGSTGRATAAMVAVTLVAAIVATTFFRAQHRIAEMALARQTAERSSAQARLRLLESQLEPHMLFNTLANLRALIGVDPARAQAMLDHLNAFLRATLVASRAPLHPLGEEFARIGDYLALMQVRMGARLQVELDLPAALSAAQLPPLLLQPLVENAIRHGLEPQRAGGRIALQARAEGTQLVLTVRDTGVGLPETASGPPEGIGLSLVHERLAAQYGQAARFTLEAAPGGGTLARVELPLQAPTEAPR